MGSSQSNRKENLDLNGEGKLPLFAPSVNNNNNNNNNNNIDLYSA